MKKWKEKRTMGPKNIKWWKCKDEMTVEYGERVRMHSLGWQRSCVVERRGKEVLREAETKDGGRKRWRRQWGRSGKHGR